jgi:predicted metalloprotease
VQLGTVEPGDLQEALNAANAIGDDAIQRQAGRVPRSHTFTHGTSEQRMRWFATGYQTGDVRSCDTFGTDNL